METRSRKRAESSSAPPAPPLPSSTSAASRTSKRSRAAAVTTRSRAAQEAAIGMDGRRSSGRSSDKGKEKETEVSRARDRAREIERSLGLDADGGGDEGDGEETDGSAALHTSSALQGLLKKLGAGFEDFLPSSVMAWANSQQSGRLKKILAGLRADGEEGKQMEALSELCDMLSIGTENSLASFAVDSFVPVLVGLLNHESSPDIMLFAARALTHLCDVLPSSCASVVHYGGVSCFCARLLTIEYMDLAEQSLQALKKISREHPTACLRAGALMAVLSYLDFFSTGVQRVALSTAANMCKRLPLDAADFVMEAVPLLTNLLQYHDSKVLEHASVCLTRIAEAFASSSDKLDELCSHGLVEKTAALFSTSNSGGGQTLLSTPTYTGLIRLLSTCARGSALGARTLHLLGISGVLKDILSGAGLVTTTVSPALTRPPEQVFEIVNLANELLPPLPQGTVSLPTCFNGSVKGSAVAKSATDAAGQVENANSSYDSSTREKLLHDQPELLRQFGMDLLPILIQIYGSSVNGPIRHECLSVIAKLMYFSTADMIQSLLSITNISCFLAGVLAWKDPQILIPAIQISEILMEKLPGTFSKLFVREGVVHAVDALILSDFSGAISIQSLPTRKDNDSINGTSCSRHYCRQGVSTSMDGSSVEESVEEAVTVGSPPGSSDAPTPNSGLHTVSTSAKAFKEKFFGSESGGAEVGASEDLIRLKNICAKLSTVDENIKSQTKGKSKASGGFSFNVMAENEEQLNGVVSEIMSELSKGDGVSTFEFIGSGVVSALLNYFSCGTFSKERVSEADLPKLRQKAIKRFKSFVATALPSSLKRGNEASMTVLVRKLQDALSSLERFPVVLSRSSGGSARISSGLNALSQPIKLRLSRVQGDKSLRDYSSNVVLIDPLASLAAVEEFLWPRIQRTDSAHKSSPSARHSEQEATATAPSASPPTSVLPFSSHCHSTRSRSSMAIEAVGRKDANEPDTSSAKGKGKAVLKAAPGETKGPQTRNAARRRAASDKDVQIKPGHGNSTSEEELEFSPADIDDALMIRVDDDMSEDEEMDRELLRDDLLPVCLPEKVHDVNLGDMADDGMIASSTNSQNQPSSEASSAAAARSTELGGSSFSSRGAMSFAAAAMSGLATVSGRGTGSRDRLGFPLGHSSKGPPKLTFSSGGKLLNRHLTIYQAIQQQLMFEEDHDERQNNAGLLPTDGNRLWSDIYTINYQKVDNEIENAFIGGSTSSPKSNSENSVLVPVSSGDMQWRHLTLLDSVLQGELPSDLEKTNDTHCILALLRVLEVLNQLAPRLRFQAISDDFAEAKTSNYESPSTTGVRVHLEEFVNRKLSTKLARQIQEALALCSGSLPSWCYQLTKACPFLFTFETRRQYFYSTAFGQSRALYRLQQQQVAENHGSTNDREVRIGRLQRQKVRVSRNRILESAAKVMEMYSSQKAVLEVEYFGEVGTGLGPTLEFYTLLSHEVQKARLQMWRSNTKPEKTKTEIYSVEDMDITDDVSQSMKLREGSGDLIHAPLGLFPCPWPPNADCTDGSKFSEVIEHFRLVGRMIAKALQDGRLLDLPLSVAFYKLILGQELDLHDILSFDAEFGRILQEMQVLVSRKHYIERVYGKDQKAIADLQFRGTPIEDLFLDFTLPGYPDYILKTGEESTLVDIYNLEEYITLVVDATVRTGIARQMEAFRAGFNQVFDITSLQIFSPDELDYLLCGRRELWQAGTLVDYIKFDHGYTAKSPAVINLLEIMGEFTPDQQRSFCQFVTGTPRLPLGGLAALNPKLTIVRKHSSSSTDMASNVSGVSDSVDDDLPSVMTCANYLKLPAYSTKEIMYKKLLYAISEGQGSFDLS